MSQQITSIPPFLLDNTHFHYSPACSRTVGPKGGVKTHFEVWRRNGKPQPQKDGSWRLPIKYGLRGYSYIDPSNVHLFHPESSCPCNLPELLQPSWTTIDTTCLD